MINELLHEDRTIMATAVGDGFKKAHAKQKESNVVFAVELG